jgi:C-terminal repeat of topoisomerase
MEANTSGNDTPALSREAPLGRCPRCGAAVTEMAERYACEKSLAEIGPCKFQINKTVLRRTIDRKQVQLLLTAGRTELITGFVSKSGRNFPAFLVIDETGKVTFEFPAQAEQHQPDNDGGKNQSTNRQPAPECKPLLDAATKNLFRNNAFRITGLPVEATARQVAKHSANLGQMAELGLAPAHHTALFALKPPPTLDEIREAAQRLKDPEKRLIDEFFWFWPCEPTAAAPDPALDALASGNADDALKAWATNEANPTSGPAAMHNIALFWHLTAIESESETATASPESPQQQTLEKHWRTCLRRWEYLTSDDGLWGRVNAHARRIDDHRLKLAFVQSMRATLPLALAKINAELALAHAEKGSTQLARMHVQLVRDGTGGPATLEKAAERVLSPLVSRLRESIRRTKETTQETPDAAANAVRDLLAHATPLPDIFDLFYGEAEHTSKELLDEAATTCVDCLVSYQKDTEDNQSFVDLLQMTLPLAEAVEVRQRIEKNIQIGKNNLAFAELEPLRTICETAAKAADANPASADNEAHRILSATSQILSKLASSGIPQDILDRAKDEVALAVMHCAVAFGNKTEKWKPCIAILEQSLRLAATSDVKARITENLQTVRKNNTLYGDLTPISSAPSLSTVNGIGFALYGCTDQDPATSSHLATYYFVFLAIPIFPICRYRVASTGSGYRFFGKAPLRTIDKWHLAISIGLIIWAIIAINSSGSASTNPPSPSPSPTYAPPPTPSAPTFTPPVSPDSPSTPTKQTYRIPNSVSTELESAKQQIAIEKAKAEALDTKLATAKQAIQSQRSQVADLQSRLDALSACAEINSGLFLGTECNSIRAERCA